MFQNSMLGIVLAGQHFGNPLTAVPCTVSSVCHSILGSALAAYTNKWIRDSMAHLLSRDSDSCSSSRRMPFSPLCTFRGKNERRLGTNSFSLTLLPPPLPSHLFRACQEKGLGVSA
ncbi:hypothetical protein EV2_008143 [Malus domestica]